MKSLTLILFLFIIKSSVSQTNQDKFSINPFLDRLREEGIFEIIQLIKVQFGEDVAIISCEEMKSNHCGNCKNAVQNYMDPAEQKPNDGLVPNSSIDNKVTLKKILSKKYNKIKAKSLYDKIIKKCKMNKIKI